MSDTEIDPDDVCIICQTKRDEHGDRNHQFSLDGQLRPLKQGPEARKPPETIEEADARSSNELPNVGRAFATLAEVLAEKGIIDTKDVIRIFSGQG